MSNGITITNGRPEMAYAGEAPWHRLGTRVAGAMTSAEAIKEAGLGWSVDLASVFAWLPERPGTVVAPARYAAAPSRRAVYRTDTRAVLGVVGAGYVPVQNDEAFAFFDAVVGRGLAMYHTAGSLGGGRRIWMLAKVPEDIVVAGHDVTELYLLLTTGHDGTHAVEMRWTPVRVVCRNTLSAALRGEGTAFKVYHTRTVATRLQAAKDALGFISDGAASLSLEYNRLAEIPLTPASLDEYLRAVYPLPTDPAIVGRRLDRAIRRVRALRDRVTDLFESGLGNDEPGTRRTLWAAYNAVAEYADHTGAFRQKRTPEEALDFTWFGGGAELKGRAYRIAGQVAFDGRAGYEAM